MHYESALVSVGINIRYKLSCVLTYLHVAYISCFTLTSFINSYFPARPRLAPPWPLPTSHLDTAFYCLLDLSTFSLISTLFYLPFYHFLRFFYPSLFVEANHQ